MSPYFCFFFLFEFDQFRAFHEITSQAEFDEKLKNAGNKVFVAYFVTTRCISVGHGCSGSESQLREILEPFGDKVEVVMINKTKLKLGLGENVTFFPTYIFFKNGQEVDRLVNVNPFKFKDIVERLTA